MIVIGIFGLAAALFGFVSALVFASIGAVELTLENERLRKRLDEHTWTYPETDR